LHHLQFLKAGLLNCTPFLGMQAKELFPNVLSKTGFPG
jgi:hypothetical protein